VRRRRKEGGRRTHSHARITGTYSTNKSVNAAFAGAFWFCTGENFNTAVLLEKWRTQCCISYAASLPHHGASRRPELKQNPSLPAISRLSPSLSSSSLLSKGVSMTARLTLRCARRESRLSNTPAAYCSLSISGGWICIQRNKRPLSSIQAYARPLRSALNGADGEHHYVTAWTYKDCAAGDARHDTRAWAEGGGGQPLALPPQLSDLSMPRPLTYHAISYRMVKYLHIATTSEGGAGPLLRQRRIEHLFSPCLACRLLDMAGEAGEEAGEGD